MDFNEKWYEVVKSEEDRQELEKEASMYTLPELALRHRVSIAKIRSVLNMYSVVAKKAEKPVKIKEKVKHTRLPKKTKENHDIAYWARTYNSGRLRYVYYDMMKRCHNPKDKGYTRYGAKGITVCDEWREDCCNFYKWAKDNGYREGLTIDRIDNSKGYSPDNCRWTTWKVQTENRSCTRRITFNGETKSLIAWSETTGISYQVLADRIYRYGWSVESALTTKVTNK